MLLGETVGMQGESLRGQVLGQVFAEFVASLDGHHRCGRPLALVEVERVEGRGQRQLVFVVVHGSAYHPPATAHTAPVARLPLPGAASTVGMGYTDATVVVLR